MPNIGHDRQLTDPPLVFTSKFLQSGSLSRNTGDSRCRALVQRWLDQCIKQHPLCRTGQVSTRPARLLDVKKAKSGGIVRLVNSADQQTLNPYATLSHCWGPNSVPVLTKSSLQSLMTGVLISELPRTFREAIEIALWLDGKYKTC